VIIFDAAHSSEPEWEFLTSDGWKAQGFHVREGEQSYARDDDDVDLFHETQVEENEDYAGAGDSGHDEA